MLAIFIVISLPLSSLSLYLFLSSLSLLSLSFSLSLSLSLSLSHHLSLFVSGLTHIVDLARNKYFEDPCFMNYLKYLRYWKQPQYIVFIQFRF